MTFLATWRIYILPCHFFFYNIHIPLNNSNSVLLLHLGFLNIVDTEVLTLLSVSYAHLTPLLRRGAVPQMPEVGEAFASLASLLEPGFPLEAYGTVLFPLYFTELQPGQALAYVLYLTLEPMARLILAIHLNPLLHCHLYHRQHDIGFSTWPLICLICQIVCTSRN